MAAWRRSARLAVLAGGLVCLVATVAPAGPDLDELLAQLQVVPMGDQVPPAFALPTLDGGQLALADLRGRAALLYFWESG